MTAALTTDVPVRLRDALRWFALWTGLGLAFATRAYLLMAKSEPWDWWRSLTSELPDWYLWGLFSLAVPRIARRFPLEPGHLRRSVPVHVASGLVITLCYLVGAVLIQAVLRAFSGVPYPLWDRLVNNFLLGYLWNLFVYIAILGFTLTTIYRRQVQAQDLRAAQLEAGLAKARLDALSSQLRPHFLFNTLNGISELVHSDAERADAMLTGLAELLRRSLAAGGAEVRLHDEMTTVLQYLDLQRIRFADRLVIETDITTEAGAAVVPSLVLLPLVENAVVHGVGGRPGLARVGVTARRIADALEVDVWDDGVGLAESPPTRGQGLGLANARERLAALHGTGAQLALVPRHPRGVVCRLRVPYRVAP